MSHEANLFPSDTPMQLSGFAGDGSQRFRFNCKLSAMQKDANTLMEGLYSYTHDATLFVSHLNKATNGAVAFEDISPTQDSTKKQRKRQHGWLKHSLPLPSCNADHLRSCSFHLQRKWRKW